MSKMNEVKKVINELLANEENRKKCLYLFLESLKKANSYGADKWGVYYQDDRIRLIVGNVIDCRH